MQASYYDRDGRPVSEQQWEQLGRLPGYSRLEYSDGVRYGRQLTVLTFWLGITAGDGPGSSLLFCTHASLRRPAGKHPAYQRLWAWPTEQAARAGHQQVTAWITDVTAWLSDHAAQLPGPAPGSLPPGEGW